MIYEIGTQRPTPEQRRTVLEIADDSFLAPLPEDFGPLPCGSKWKRDDATGIALRLRCCEPHTDTWLGVGKMPSRYAAVFWVVDLPRGGELFLQVGTRAERMMENDFVVFKDSVMHSVVSERTWWGCSYQLRFKK